jgi:iron complex outermembrane receptor protein
VETSEQFIEKGALNLSQTTSYLAGVTAETYGFATRGDWIHARGMDIPRYRDSIQELFGSYNTTRADVYTIEQVEVLRGPASVLYGQGSPGGIVNYVSKIPHESASSEFVAEFGSFDRAELAVDITRPTAGADENLRYRLVGLYRDSDTQVDYADDDTLLLMPSVTFAPSDESSFTVIALHQHTHSDTGAQFIPVEGTLFPLENGSFIDQDVYAGEPDFNRFNTQSSQLTFLAEHLINETLALEATALWRDGEADYHQAWPIFVGAGRRSPGPRAVRGDLRGTPRPPDLLRELSVRCRRQLSGSRRILGRPVGQASDLLDLSPAFRSFRRILGQSSVFRSRHEPDRRFGDRRKRVAREAQEA